MSSRQLWRDFRWPIIGGAGVLALCLGIAGFTVHYDLIKEPRSFSDILYLSLQLFTMKSGFLDPPVPWTLEAARLLAPAVAAFAAIQALAAIFRDQFQLLRLRSWSGHVVLCGLGEKGLALVKGFRERGSRVVVIERDGSNPFIGQCRGPRTIVLTGDAADRETLTKAGVERAKQLVAVCMEDGVNAGVGTIAGELTRNRPGDPLHASVHIGDVELCRMLQGAREAGMPGAAEMTFFNIYETGARSMLDECTTAGVGGASRKDPPQLLVVGMGRLGRSLVVQAARDWKTNRGKCADPLRITCVDREAKAKTQSLSLLNPELEGIWDFKPLQLDVTSPEFEEGSFLFDAQGRCDLSVAYVCFDEDGLSLATGLKIHRRLGAQGPPIVIRMVQISGLGLLLHFGECGSRSGGFGNLRAFGLIDRTCRPDLLIINVEKLARIIHEVYVLHRKEQGETVQTNPAIADWVDLDDGLKESNRHQARDIPRKLARVGCGIDLRSGTSQEEVKFTPEEVEILAEMEHERWCDERLRSGWTYAAGPKDIIKKTSPYLVTWNGLSEKVKDYDRNTVRHMPNYLSMAGQRVFRLKGK